MKKHQPQMPIRRPLSGATILRTPLLATTLLCTALLTPLHAAADPVDLGSPGQTTLEAGAEASAAASMDGPQAGGAAGFVFSTYPGIEVAPWTVVSQRLLGVFIDPPANTTEFRGVGADDFTVTGDGWRIDEIEVRGTYFNGSGPAESMSVYFLADSGGAPASTDLAGTSIRAYENISYAEIDFGDPRIPLVNSMGNPDPLFLPPGTYWVVVQANMNFAAGGQWGWTESSDGVDTGNTHGAESHWFQNFPAVSGLDGSQNCLSAWGPRVTECQLTRPADPTVPERDFAFRLAGEALVAQVSIDTTALETSEPATAASFQVSLTAPPRGSVDVPIGAPPAAQATASATLLTFDPTTWDEPQTVTVTPMDDLLPEAPAMFTLSATATSSSDPNFDSLAVPIVNITQFDDDQAGILTAAVGALTVAENGGQATFSINLTAPLGPGETLTVPLSAVPPSAVQLPPSVVFTAADGTDPRQIQVTGLNDDIAHGDRVLRIETGDPSSTNPVFDALTAADVPDVVGIVLDNDAVGFDVLVVGAGSAITSETGANATFSVRLRSEPLAQVTIDVFSSDSTEASVDLSTLSFSPGTWDQPQQVEISGIDDPFDDGDISYSVVLGPAESSDLGYDNFDPQDVTALNLDDDEAAVVISPITGLTTTEDAGMANFTVVLAAEPQFPIEPVRLTLTVDDTSEGEISADGVIYTGALQLSFDDTNWDQPMVIQVRGVDDALLDGDRLFTIITGDPEAGDPAYDGLAAEDVDDVLVVNLDNEVVTDVPTLGQWALLLMAFLLLASALKVLRETHSQSPAFPTPG